MTETLDITITKTEESKLSNIDFDNLSFGKTYSDHMFVADYEDGEWKIHYTHTNLIQLISKLQ